MMFNRVARPADAPRFARFASPAALGALLIGICCSGCGGGGGVVVGKEPFSKVVEVENNVDALRAWAEAGTRASVLVHIDPSEEMAVIPAHLTEDMENAAGHLKRRNGKALEEIAPMIERGGTINLGYMAGIYKRVIWVIPTLRPVGDDPVDAYKNYLIEQRKYPEAAIGDLKSEGKFITGTVAGVPITITRLADLALAEGEDAIVDIDLSFFPAMKLASPSYRVGTRSFLEFVRDLGKRNVRAKLVTVNHSNLSNQVPMDLRFGGDVIREALAKPDAAIAPLPAKWQGMIQAEDSLGAKRYASAAAIYEDIIRAEKRDAGLYFSLAVARGFENKGAECRAALIAAYRLDSEYLKGFFQLARVLAAADKLEAGLEILDMKELATIAAPVEMDYQRGMFFYTAHRPFDAATYLTNVAQQRPKDFGLFTILFRAHREAGNDKGQIFALRKLVGIDEGRVRRDMPWVFADLGDLYEKDNLRGNAAEMYEKYLKARPDDSLSAVLKKRIEGWKAKKLI